MALSKSKLIPRVTQLDAYSFDEHIFDILKNSVTTITQPFNPSLISGFLPEVHALLRLVIWKLSVYKDHSTFGQQLLGIKYEGELHKIKAVLRALLTILPRYVEHHSSTLLHMSRNHSNLRWVVEILHWIQTCIQISNVINFFLFLMHGEYPSLVDRLLRQRSEALRENQQRNIGYNFMVQEMLWHGFTEFLMFLVPLINYSLVRKTLRKLFVWKKPVSVTQQSVIFTATTKCAVCRMNPVLPYHIGCSHVFCFYCVHSHFIAESRFECPECGMVISSESNILVMQPFHVK